MRVMTKTLRRLLQVCVAAALILIPSWNAAVHSDGPVVGIDSGLILGDVNGAVASFKGIPFAQPPLGALRWRPPQPLVWRGLRQAISYGPDCMQVPVRGDSAPLRTTPSEDCLYLNVWAPVRFRDRKLPVMVWIFGGAFVNGGSSPQVFDGSAFARDGVVLVSFNYRLGNFGFFAHPALTAEQPGALLGNYGYMDQLAALQWVQRNAAAFGGDPHNVTVFGESAGGVAIHALLTSPLAIGLFKRAIIESGAGRRNMLPPTLRLHGTPDSAENRGLVLARSLGVEGSNAQALAQLRALPAKKLRGKLNFSTFRTDPNYVGGPIEDGALDVGTPVALYAQGRAQPVPVVVGANNSDYGNTSHLTVDQLLAQYGTDAQAARAAYVTDQKIPASSVSYTMTGDQIMVEPAREVARQLSGRQPVFAYRFSYVAESERAKMPGASHASEIPYVFDTVATFYGRRLTAADEAAAQAIHAYWVGFARTGVPAAQGYPAWPVYQPTTDQLMDFTSSGPRVTVDPWKARLDVAQRYNASH